MQDLCVCEKCWRVLIVTGAFACHKSVIGRCESCVRERNVASPVFVNRSVCET